MEREYDARMRRTASRPLPSGRLQPVTVMLFGGICSLLGTVYLAALVNPLTSALGAISLVSYLFIYTPLKRLTWWNTAVGAIPGALPPLMGWAAARGELTVGGWAMFAILAFWQTAAFLCHCVDLSGRIREGRISRCCPPWIPMARRTGATIGQSHAGPVDRESDAGACSIWRGRFIWRRALWCWVLVYLVCAIQFARRLDRAQRAESCFSLRSFICRCS
ncbi:MAG: protoheme IX farnesyltransferase [Verrucomicrobiota bacterium]